MNVNKLIKRLKDELGLSEYMKLSFTDKDIYDNIVIHSLEEWSHYFKQEVTFTNIHLDKSLMVGPDVYAIPQYIVDKVQAAGLVIEDIKDYRFIGDQAVAGIGSYAGNFMNDMNFGDSYAAFYANYRQGSAEALSMLNHACFFEKPNKLRFVFSRAVTYTINCMMTFYVSQSPNLSAISETREHDFFDLCKLNLMIYMYNNEAKFIESIQSGLGSINLKIDDWAQAPERKAELLKDLLRYSAISQAAHFLTI